MTETMYSIKTPNGYLRDFGTQELILVPESFVAHWKPQLTTEVEFVPAGPVEIEIPAERLEVLE